MEKKLRYIENAKSFLAVQKDCLDIFIRNLSKNDIVFDGSIPVRDERKKFHSFRGSRFRGISKNKEKWQVKNLN